MLTILFFTRFVVLYVKKKKMSSVMRASPQFAQNKSSYNSSLGENELLKLNA